ncbi:MAG TPA: hypothetical protein VHR18_11420 [Solirubrobacterales bacterium]|jgi:hypothetical protein|nr:hypothetical protein [Solirubrobacterales bacterium]
MTHDPLDFAEELGRKLATRSRHVCALFGAGVSRACGLPDVSGLQKAVAEKLGKTDRKAFEALLEDRSLEEGLSHLRRVAALLGDDQELAGLDKKGRRPRRKDLRCHRLQSRSRGREDRTDAKARRMGGRQLLPPRP